MLFAYYQIIKQNVELLNLCRPLRSQIHYYLISSKIHAIMSQHKKTTGMLKFSCKGLKSKDAFSKSDPIIVVSMRSQSKIDSKFEVIGHTEKLNNNSNPEFETIIEFPYRVQDSQELKFDILDSDSKKDPLEKTELIHSITVSVADLLKKSRGLGKFLWNNDKSSLSVKYESNSMSNDTIYAEISCSGLPKMDTFGKIDPFLVFYRLGEDGKTWLKAFETEHKNSTYAPEWEMNAELYKLCNGALRNPVKIVLFDWEKSGKHEYTAECETTMHDLIDNRSLTLTFTNQKKKNCGTITFKNVVHTKKKNFSDLVTAGLNLQTFVAIDCTASNLDPDDINSLHYAHSKGDNQYQEVIRKIVGIFKHYDTDSKFPAWGFGAKLNSSDEVSHNFDFPVDPELSGEDQVLDAYKKGIKNVTFSGPTNVSDILLRGFNLAKENVGKKCWSNLLLLTDGSFNDIKSVINIIAQNSDLPMSVTIIGIGDGDFSDMQKLDGDVDPLVDSNNFKAKNDVVQFVEFNKVKKEGPYALAETVVEELTKQIEKYYSTHSDFK